METKKCTQCLEVKELDCFYTNNAVKSGKTAACKECLKKKSAEWRKNNPKPKKKRQQVMTGFRLLPKGMRKCSTCKEVKGVDFFYKDKTRASGCSSKCKKCTNIYNKNRRANSNGEHLKARRIWAKKNRDRLREQEYLYRINNREKSALIESRRRARKKNLPDTLTENQLDGVLEFFDYKCCICDDKYEHMDHFIPLKVEKAGTTLENIVPMCSKCNISKRDRNPFEWIKTKPKQERERFNSLVEYLSYINGIAGIRDYKAYVYKCFK